MKLRNLFYLLLAMPLLAVGCTKNATDEVKPEPEPEPQPNQPKLTLVSDAVMNFAAEGGEGVIEYTLENAVEGTTLAATCEAQWVADVTVGETVTFTVEANEVEEARETSVVVAYGELSFVVTVKQAAYKAAPLTPVFELVSEATMEFGQDSAVGTIEFKLENPVDGVNVTAKSNQSWVNNISVRQDEGQIAFMVDANTGAAREATITATYGMLEFKVVVKQAEYVAPAPEIIIESVNESFEAAGGEGEIAFRIKNAVEGVEATATTTAEWITVNSCADGIVAFSVAANETESLREGVITLAYGEATMDVKIQQLFEGYNPGMEYSVFEVVEVFASSGDGGKVWEVIFIEKDPMLGEMQTRICFNLPEANAQRVSDGTYTVENGGILVNSANQNGYSSYRSNGSLAADIIAAEIAVATDTDAKIITIAGTFQAGNAIVTLDYTGEIRGMDLGEAVSGTIVCNEWASVKKNYEEAGQFMFTAKSADGALEILFDILHSGGTKLCPEGTYEVADWSWEGDVLENTSKIKYNGVEAYMKEGYVTVEHISGGYIFTFEITDANDRSFSGVIEGPVQSGTNPA